MNTSFNNTEQEGKQAETSPKKKFGWGWGIALFYMSFVVFMLFMVWNANRQQVEMVDQDYYKKELAYQSQIDRQKRTGALSQPLGWELDSGEMILNFPADVASKGVNADILFYRPSDSHMDVSLSASTGPDGVCRINTEKLQRGLYLMQITWRAGGVEYYNEEEIQIP